MNSFFDFSHGKFQYTVFEDSFVELDLRKVFAQVSPDELLSNIEKTGEKGFLYPTGFNCLMVKYEGTNILVDTGKGIDNLIKNMSLKGITPDDIDYIIITHSDFDHVGGLKHFDKSKIFFQKAAYELWTNETSRQALVNNYQRVFSKFAPEEQVQKGMAFRNNFGSKILPALKNRIRLVEAEEEFLPGIKMIPTPGHRLDHFAVEFTSESKTLLHVADAFRHPIQILHPSWYGRFDSNPQLVKQSIELLIGRAKEKDALIFGAHFKFPGITIVDEQKGLSYVYDEK